MIVGYDDLIESLPKEAIDALIRDCVIAMGDFSNASPADLDQAVQQTLQKIKLGKLLVEFGEASETFALISNNKFR